MTSHSPAPLPPTLRRLDGQPPIGEYVREVWQRRHFALAVAAGRMRGQHMDTVLGNLWHVLTPSLLVLVYYLIFGIILDTSRGLDNFLGFLTVGIFVYNHTTRTITQGANSIVTNIGLIRSLQFPRALLPLSAVIQQVIAFAGAFVVMVLVLLITQEPLRVRWIMAFPSLALTAMFGFGCALFAARMTDKIRDFSNLLPFFFRIMFYLSGILYSIEFWVDDPTLQRLWILDPFYVYVSLPRAYLMTSFSPADVGLLWISAVVWAVLALTVGGWFFRRGELEFGRG